MGALQGAAFIAQQKDFHGPCKHAANTRRHGCIPVRMRLCFYRPGPARGTTPRAQVLSCPFSRCRRGRDNPVVGLEERALGSLDDKSRSRATRPSAGPAGRRHSRAARFMQQERANFRRRTLARKLLPEKRPAMSRAFLASSPRTIRGFHGLLDKDGVFLVQKLQAFGSDPRENWPQGASASHILPFNKNLRISSS